MSGSIIPAITALIVPSRVKPVDMVSKCLCTCAQAQRKLYKEHLWTAYRVPYALGRALARWTLLLRQWRDAPATEAAFQVSKAVQQDGTV